MRKKIPARDLAKLKAKFPEMKVKPFLSTIFSSDSIKREFFTPDLSVDFGLWVRDSRETRGMTVAELAKISGVKARVINALEAGKLMPECDFMGPIAFAFAMTTDKKNWRMILTKFGEYKIAK